MIGKVTVYLLILSISLVLAQIPTGCVTLYSPPNKRYLVTPDKYDDKRRNVAAAYTEEQVEKWIITSDGPNYRIKHAKLQEELYESELSYGGNYVFTWIPKDVLSGNHERWQIIKNKEGDFLIKNVQFGHCLYVIGPQGLLSADTECNTMYYKWIITKVKC
uniref:Putative wrp salivary protein n=1 Tax=Corethrella appendiculata TaxID=1370023 RepID=U5EM14_9DIPT